MKRLFRIVIFSAFALFLTSFWDKGFIIPSTGVEFVKATAALALFFLIVRPIMKIVFLPFNMLTLGLFSFVVYVLVLYILSSWYGLFTIHSWQFYGLNLFIVSIPKLNISYVGNLVLSSFSLSSIINLLDQLT